jgi:CBS-domain-containing membrane protein
LGIAAVAILNFNVLDRTSLVMVIGSFGASAVLIYGAIRSPLAQPRNLVGGHLLSAIVGVAAYQFLGQVPWLAAGVMLVIALLVNNIPNSRRYPEFWL